MPRHRPKALDWRTISVEIGIIVVGVLIALGADQAVRSLHEQRQVVDAKSDFQSELTELLFAAMERVNGELCREATERAR